MDQALICEMSPRDGLQHLGGGGAAAPRLVPRELKLRLIEALRGSGLRYVEVGAFVSTRLTPQMADTDALCAGLTPRPGEMLAALVPNLRHYERFRSTRLNTVALFVSASEAYSRANMGVPIREALEWAGLVADAARADGRQLRGHVSAAFQEIGADDAESDLRTVVDVSRRLVEAGCAHVALADTDGRTSERRIRNVLAAVGAELGLERVGVHLHTRGGNGLPNALAALDAGVRIFDASVGGIGGSATARHASGDGDSAMAGNVATEVLVEEFERRGVSTGVDRGALHRAAVVVREIVRFVEEPDRPAGKRT